MAIIIIIANWNTKTNLLVILSNLSFLKNILLISLSAFGGPQGHLLSITKHLVEKNKFLTKAELLNYYSFCSLLPGATSTQLICLIAFRKGGLKLVVPSLLIWISPACLIMLSLSLLLIDHDLIDTAEDIFLFFKPMVVSFMIYASYMAKTVYYKQRSDLLPIILNVIVIISFFKHPFIIPILFIINALYSHYCHSGHFSGTISKFLQRFSFDRRFLLIYILLFTTFGVLSEYSRKFETTNRYYFNIIEHNFRFGSVVYGGGDVLIPLMYEQYISRPTAKVTQRRNPDVLQLKKDELMTGAGIIRLIPGPVFSLTSFTSPYLLKEFDTHKKIIGSLLSSLAIFTPGILILLILIPFWNTLFQNKTFVNLVSGINVTVFSIMIASSVYLLVDLLYVEQDSIIESSVNFILVLSILSLLKTQKLNHAQISFICLVLGLTYHFL